MQSPASDAGHSHDCYVVCPWGGFAALLGRAAGVELAEQELLAWLRLAQEPITYCLPTSLAVTSPASPPAASAAAHARPARDRLVVRLPGALAALLGRAEGAEGSEHQLLLWLREAGLITYPSPLLKRLLEELPHVFAAEVLPKLGPADLALLSRVGITSRAVVMSSGLPRAGAAIADGGVPLRLRDFVFSGDALEWALDNGWPWPIRTCVVIARYGTVQALQRARELKCHWDYRTYSVAASSGRLEILQWAWDNGCEWGTMTIWMTFLIPP